MRSYRKHKPDHAPHRRRASNENTIRNAIVALSSLHHVVIDTRAMPVLLANSELYDSVAAMAVILSRHGRVTLTIDNDNTIILRL